MLIQNLGLVAVGRTLDEAFNNALSVEYTAMVNIYGKILRDLIEIESYEVQAIRKYILQARAQKYGQKEGD